MFGIKISDRIHVGHRTISTKTLFEKYGLVIPAGREYQVVGYLNRGLSGGEARAFERAITEGMTEEQMQQVYSSLDKMCDEAKNFNII